MIVEETCQIDLNKPGKYLRIDVPDYDWCVASVYIISTAGTAFASGTLNIDGSVDGYNYTNLWEFDAEGVARINTKGFRYLRAGVGTKASSSVQVHVTLSTTND